MLDIDIITDTRVPPLFHINVGTDQATAQGPGVRQLDAAARRAFIRFIADRARVAVKRFDASGSGADRLRAETALLEWRPPRLRARHRRPRRGGRREPLWTTSRNDRTRPVPADAPE